MPDRRTATVDDNGSGARLDVFLGGLPQVPSRSAAAGMIEAGAVTVNGRIAAKKQIVLENDLVEYELPVESPAIIKPEFIPLDIRYEDDYLIVLSKQAGLVCHPSAGHESGTLANALVAHCGIEHLGTLQGEDRPGIVHRLDMDTTGLMLAAKDDATQASLQDAIRIRSIDRRYFALVHGNIAPDTGLIDAPIARAPRMRMKMEVSDDPSARSSITTFTTLERFDASRFDQGYTLLECKLYTGRTHQIRVHMAYISHPVVGDQLYGRQDAKADRGLTRQFLHSYSLEFDHPETGEHLSFLDPLPYDLEAMLDDIAPMSAGRTEEGERILGALEEAE